MVMAAVLISVVVAAGPAASQTPPAQAPPYTISGVRRAATEAAKPKRPGQGGDEAAAAPDRPIAKSAEKQKLDVAVWSPPPPAFRLPDDERNVTTSLAPHGPAWHQDFLAMTTPAYYAPFGNSGGNAETIESVVSSMAFALAFQGAAHVIKHAYQSYKNGKLEKLRREIDEETAIAEREYKARLAAEKKK